MLSRTKSPSREKQGMWMPQLRTKAKSPSREKQGMWRPQHRTKAKSPSREKQGMRGDAVPLQEKEKAPSPPAKREKGGGLGVGIHAVSPPHWRKNREKGIFFAFSLAKQKEICYNIK